VYVRDQYKLGTREWLEGDNRAAFAQTLERMLDAVRLNYWQPDAATKKELVQAYQQALKATGLRESNLAVQRFASAQLSAAPLNTSAQAPAARSPQTEARPTPPDEAAPTPVRGLKLEPQAPEAKTPSSVVNSLAAMWGVALLMALGAWLQSRRWRRAGLTAARV
jgi:cobaltochelatase CobN